jgi:hypothetical protein
MELIAGVFWHLLKEYGARMLRTALPRACRSLP